MAAPTEGQSGFTSVKYNGYTWSDGTYTTKVMTLNPDGYVQSCYGATLPVGTAGYAIGCHFYHSDGGSGTAVYVNNGSVTVCSFSAIPTTAGTTATAITVANSTDTTSYLVFVGDPTGDQGPKTNVGLTFNATTGVLTATGFSGPITGALTGAITGSGAGLTAGSVKASALQAAAADLGAANVTIDLSNTNGAFVTNFTIDGTMTAGAFAGPLTGAVTGNVTGNCTGSAGSVTGNAGTATALQTARAIGGVSFDGTASIVPQSIQVLDTVDTSCYVALFEDATGNLLPKTDAGISYNAGTGTLTVTAITAPITMTDEATDTSCFPLFSTTATGANTPHTNTSFTFNSNTGAFGATSIAIPSTGAISFNTANDKVSSSGAGQLDIDSTAEVEVGTGILDINLTTENTYAMDVSVAQGSTEVGGAIRFVAGQGFTAKAGGAIVFTAGAGTTTGAGGAITATTGAGGATGASGVLTLATGTAAGANSGAASFKSGDVVLGNTGDVTIASGAAGTGNGGTVYITAGAATTGEGGHVNIAAGASGGGGSAGMIDIGSPLRITGTTNGLECNAATEKVFSSGAGQLDIDAATEVEITSPTVQIAASTLLDCNVGGVDIDITEDGAFDVLIATQGTATVAGGAVSIVAGAGNTTGIGGTVAVTAGAGGNNAAGAQAEFKAGAAGGGDNVGGEVKVTAGAGIGSGNGGAATITAGAAGATGTGGGIVITGGVSTAGTSGGVEIKSGAPTAGNVGTINIAGGTATDGDGGSITITASAGIDPAAGNQNGGNVTITAGAAANGGTAGVIGLASDVDVGDGKKVSFRGVPATSTEYIYSSGASVLDIVGPTINLTAGTKVDVSGNLEVSNDLTTIGRFVQQTVTEIDLHTAGTLDVSVGNIFKLTATGAHNLVHGSAADASNSDITNGTAGQEITLIFGDGNVTVKDANTLMAAGDLVSSANDTMKLVFDGTNWYEISRSVN